MTTGNAIFMHEEKENSRRTKILFKLKRDFIKQEMK
jgi:hypothetical protein